MKSPRTERSHVVAVSMVLATIAGCGAGAPRSETVPLRSESDRDRGPGDPPVSRGAQERWRVALAAYDRARDEGLTAEACARVIGAFEAADAAQSGGLTEAVYMIGVTQDACGHPDEARAVYARVLARDADFCGARVALALEHYGAGRIAEARTELERAVRGDPRCTEGYVNLAILQRRSPAETADALDNLRRALATRADYLPALNQMALLYLEQATRGPDEPSRQLLDLAEVVCRQAQLIDPGYAPIYNTWGLVNVRQGNIIAALAKFERAFELDDDLFEAYMNFGELTLSFRGYEDARAAFSRAAELRESSYDAQLGLGAAQRGLGHPDEAEAAYERAIAIDASRPEAYFNLGVLSQDYRDGSEAALARARGHYEEFVRRAGTSPAFAEAVSAVTHQCASVCVGPAAAPSTHRRRAACAMGRMQQIEEALCLQRTLAAEPTAPDPAP